MTTQGAGGPAPVNADSALRSRSDGGVWTATGRSGCEPARDEGLRDRRAVGRSEVCDIRRLAGQDQSAAGFGRNGDDVSINDVPDPAPASVQDSTDEAGEGAIRVTAVDGGLVAREQRVDLLDPCGAAIGLGENDGRRHDPLTAASSGVNSAPHMALARRVGSSESAKRIAVGGEDHPWRTRM